LGGKIPLVKEDNIMVLSRDKRKPRLLDQMCIVKNIGTYSKEKRKHP